MLSAFKPVPELRAQALQPLMSKGTTHPDARGVWQNNGYGWMLNVDSNQMTLYHNSAAGCLKDEASTEEIAMIAQFFAVEAGQLTVSMQQEQSTRYFFQQADAVPAGCNQEMAATPQQVFDYFWGVMDAHYAFFDTYGVDWAARRAAFETRISTQMTEQALFEVFSEMLAGLNDGHLELYGDIDGEDASFSGSRPRVLSVVMDAAFEAQDEIEEKSAFYTEWFFSDLRRLRTRVLNRRGQGRAAGGNMNWGRINNMGYISVFGMGGFADDDAETLQDEIDALHAAMDQALTDLADTDGLIFDVSLNQGGMDEISLAIASHFTSERQLAYTKTALVSDNDPQRFYVTPAEGVRYLKPVTLLTSDLTVSAAEIFTLAMRALPQVTHRGGQTWGAFSDILTKPLPNGWVLELSNEVYRDSAGNLWEGEGIPPEDKYELFDVENIYQSRHNAILSIARTMDCCSW